MTFAGELRDGFIASGKGLADELREYDGADRHGAIQFVVVTADIVDSARSTVAALAQGESVAVAEIGRAASADLKHTGKKAVKRVVKSAVGKQVTKQAIARGLSEKVAGRVGGGVGHVALKVGEMGWRREKPAPKDLIKISATTGLTVPLSATPLTPVGAAVASSLLVPRLEKFLDDRL